jgi:hypothetical protein
MLQRDCYRGLHSLERGQLLQSIWQKRRCWMIRQHLQGTYCMPCAKSVFPSALRASDRACESSAIGVGDNRKKKIPWGEKRGGLFQTHTHPTGSGPKLNPVAPPISSLQTLIRLRARKVLIAMRRFNRYIPPSLERGVFLNLCNSCFHFLCIRRLIILKNRSNAFLPYSPNPSWIST